MPWPSGKGFGKSLATVLGRGPVSQALPACREPAIFFNNCGCPRFCDNTPIINHNLAMFFSNNFLKLDLTILHRCLYTMFIKHSQAEINAAIFATNHDEDKCAVKRGEVKSKYTFINSPLFWFHQDKQHKMSHRNVQNHYEQVCHPRM